MAPVIVRDYRADDAESVRRVVEAAFAQPDEADLVQRLRADGDAIVELVAEADGAIVGHILYSALAIETPGAAPLKAAALAPVSVAPTHQHRGVCAALIRAGDEACAALGRAAIIVLGHPDYYPKFGYSARAAESLDAPFSGPAFMVKELAPGVLNNGGKVRYAKAFGV